MDLEDSISSWIGKIREGFDTFCSEAKDILPKHVQNMQEKLIRAAENLKQLRCDLDIFSTCMLDYSENGKGLESDESEENMDSHAENKPSGQKKYVTECAEVEEKIPESVAIVNNFVVEKDTAKSAEVEEKIDLGCDNGDSNARLCPIPADVEPLNLKELEFHHPPLISFEFSNDDIHTSNLSEAQSSPDFDLLEEELGGEVIRDRFTSPLSDSTFDYETESGLLDVMIFLDSDSDSDLECWSNFTQSPVFNIAEDWERLQEDWEIV